MKFHDELNQKLFNGQELRPEVSDKLKEIADAFIEYMEINENAVKDVVITGSSASYNYTPHSDLDLHLKIDYSLIHENCPIVEGYLWSLKAAFNRDHDISIYGVPVEVYAESIDQDTVHNGLYSLWQGKWLDVPEKIPPTDNDAAVQAKYDELKEACDNCDDSEVAQELLNKIYEMRKAGLEEVGEFSTENLAFKKLRDAGVIDRLKEIKKAQVDKQLSLESYQLSKAERIKYSNLGSKKKKVKESYIRLPNYKQQIVSMIKQLGLDIKPNNIEPLEMSGGDATKESFMVAGKKHIVTVNNPIDSILFSDKATGKTYEFKASGFDHETGKWEDLTMKEQENEDMSALVDKIDNAQAELDALIKSIKNESCLDKLVSTIDEALA